MYWGKELLNFSETGPLLREGGGEIEKLEEGSVNYSGIVEEQGNARG
jgi:hypothetical protein